MQQHENLWKGSWGKEVKELISFSHSLPIEGCGSGCFVSHKSIKALDLVYQYALKFTKCKFTIYIYKLKTSTIVIKVWSSGLHSCLCMLPVTHKLEVHLCDSNDNTLPYLPRLRNAIHATSEQ